MLALALLMGGCQSDGASLLKPAPAGELFSPADLVKTDIDMVLEIQQQEALGHLRTLMEKLYRRNPRELARNSTPSLDRVLERVFDHPPPQWRFPELDNQSGVRCIQMALEETFEGDRVMAFVGGLTAMVMASYDFRTSFYLIDQPGDPQRYYNSARNIEIAMWRLSHERDDQGRLFLLSDEREGPVMNHSFERITGKLVAIQDTTARIVAQKTRRAVKQVMHFVASAVFLPM